jgi:FtsP/CotA-like multicopper oxidase with cupredoxin domain
VAADPEVETALNSSGLNQSSGKQLSRRQFLSAAAAFAAVTGFDHHGSAQPPTLKPDVNLLIARCEIEVAPGHRIQTTAYNGDPLGDPIRLREGAPMWVEIQNQTGVGEYVHWHGFSLDARVDGTAEENSLGVAPYSRLAYQVPGQAAGSYYVHSHAMAHHDLTAGTYSGQFAFIYVDPHQNPGRYDKEVFLTSHEWEPYFINEAEEAKSLEEMHHVRLDTDDDDEMGGDGWDVRYRLASLNGKALGHGEPICVVRGERILFHFLNASATESLQLALPGHQFRVVGLDGHRVARASVVDVLTIGVGERVDAVVEMNMPGVWVLGSIDDDIRSKGLGVVVEYAGQHGEARWASVSAPAWDYGIFGEDGRCDADEEVAMRLVRLPAAEDGFERWTIAGAAEERQEPLQRVFQKGRRYRLAIKNESNECHPMHLHRHSFELSRYLGRPTTGIRKDTVMVVPYGSVELIFTPAAAGPALFHCHNQMHMDSGLQTLFNVVQ